jgi:hypothetical protein
MLGLPPETAELVLDLTREAAHLSCGFFADLMADFPHVVHRLFSSQDCFSPPSLLPPAGNSGASTGASWPSKIIEIG